MRGYVIRYSSEDNKIDMLECHQEVDRRFLSGSVIWLYDNCAFVLIGAENNEEALEKAVDIFARDFERRANRAREWFEEFSKYERLAENVKKLKRRNRNNSKKFLKKPCANA